MFAKFPRSVSFSLVDVRQVWHVDVRLTADRKGRGRADCPPDNRLWLTSSQTDSLFVFFMWKMVAQVNYTCGKHQESKFKVLCRQLDAHCGQPDTRGHHVWKQLKWWGDNGSTRHLGGTDCIQVWWGMLPCDCDHESGSRRWDVACASQLHSHVQTWSLLFPKKALRWQP